MLPEPKRSHIVRLWLAPRWRRYGVIGAMRLYRIAGLGQLPDPAFRKLLGVDAWLCSGMSWPQFCAAHNFLEDRRQRRRGTA